MPDESKDVRRWRVETEALTNRVAAATASLATLARQAAGLEQQRLALGVEQALIDARTAQALRDGTAALVGDPKAPSRFVALKGRAAA